MMEIGKIQKLKVIKEKDFGIYLSDGDKADAQGVLLPKKPALIKLYLHRLREAVDGADDPRIPVENAFTLIHRDSVAVAYFPLDLIIVLDLHDLIAHTEDRPAGLFLLLIRRRRVKLLLKLLI